MPILTSLMAVVKMSGELFCQDVACAVESTKGSEILNDTKVEIFCKPRLQS